MTTKAVREFMVNPMSILCAVLKNTRNFYKGVKEIVHPKIKILSNVCNQNIFEQH